MSYPQAHILYLSEKDMLAAGVNNIVSCTDCMEEVAKLLDDGDYRMGSENGNSHGCMIRFPYNSLAALLEIFQRLPTNRKMRNFHGYRGLHLIFSRKRVTLIALTMTGGNNHGCN